MFLNKSAKNTSFVNPIVTISADSCLSNFCIGRFNRSE